MAERNVWPAQNSGPTGLLSVEDTRLATAASLSTGVLPGQARSGFRPVGTGGFGSVYATTPTPDGNVKVDAFQLVLQTSRSSVSGPYICTLDSTKTTNILSTPANATNPRDDLIIARVKDTFYADASSAFTIEQIVGTPAAVPVDPTVTGSQDYIPLARVRVIANAVGTDITQARITDLRTGGHAKSMIGLFTVGMGGVLPILSLTERNAIPAGAQYDGYTIWRTDTNAFNVWDGSEWRYFARPTDNTVATSQGTSSVTFVDLGTAGPAVTVETGLAAEVTVTATISNSATFQGRMSFAVSGATTRAARDDEAIFHPQSTQQRFSGTYTVTGLTPGSNIFTAKYRTDNGANTATFVDRKISVRPI